MPQALLTNGRKLTNEEVTTVVFPSHLHGKNGAEPRKNKASVDTEGSFQARILLALLGLLQEK
ncbi:hypothetical protein [Mycetocola tolaasinivorans]|uniref:hypothetical protein n=1 Tax=Mycetocola tolaasinivorans TaxID=76635 RepID=UPI000EF45EA5|nr:hypothetical protein [Mycetocola tolaasinivorans]